MRMMRLLVAIAFLSAAGAGLTTLASCIQLPSAERPASQFVLAELLDWTPKKFVATFGQPAVIVETERGQDYYWEAGEQPPVERIAMGEFSRRYPVTDFRLLPFCLVASFAGERVEMVYLTRSYEQPASRVSFAGKNLRALKRDEMLQELGPPEETARVGLRQDEMQYSWQLSAGEGPLPELPCYYGLALTCDRFGRVTSVKVERSS